MNNNEKIALVTGATRGIGTETVRQLAEAGVRVVLAGRDAGKAEAAAAPLQAQGLPVESIALDVNDAASIDAAAKSIDPAQLVSYKLAMADVTQAIAEQNAQIAPGAIGASPTVDGQRVTIPLTVDGQLQTVEQFRNIVLLR